MATTRTNIEALRRKAEEYMKKACETVRIDKSKQDALTLMHELQVYQLELEMQCEEMRRAQLDLEENRNRYAELYESIPVGYFTFDRLGTIEEVNPAGCAMLDRRPEELRGTRFQLNIFSADRRVFTEFCRSILQSQERRTCEVRIAPDNGTLQAPGAEEVRTVLLEGSPVKNAADGEDRLRAAAIDITERKATERQLEQQDRELRASRHALQEVNARVLRAQDDERRTIARELHDDCCQQLALLVITANSIERLAPQPVARKLQAMGTQLKQVLDTTRHIAYGLHPAMWETTGIEEAARTYIQDFISITELPVDFHSVDIPKNLPRSIATCLFRTLQEALHNVVKYADASAVTVRLEKSGQDVILTVTDNGRGFDLQNSASTPRGLGLISLRERVHLLQGSLDVQSRSGQGTTVRSSLPLANFV
jgi:PAS domain S-box-containing protein